MRNVESKDAKHGIQRCEVSFVSQRIDVSSSMIQLYYTYYTQLEIIGGQMAHRLIRKAPFSAGRSRSSQFAPIVCDLLTGDFSLQKLRPIFQGPSLFGNFGQKNLLATSFKKKVERKGPLFLVRLSNHCLLQFKNSMNHTHIESLDKKKKKTLSTNHQNSWL